MTPRQRHARQRGLRRPGRTRSPRPTSSTTARRRSAQVSHAGSRPPDQQDGRQDHGDRGRDAHVHADGLERRHGDDRRASVDRHRHLPAARDRRPHRRRTQAGTAAPARATSSAARGPACAAGDAAHIVVKTTVGSPSTDPFTNTASVSGGGGDSSRTTTRIQRDDERRHGIGDRPRGRVPHRRQRPGQPRRHAHLHGRRHEQRHEPIRGPGAIVRVVFPDTGVPPASMSVAASNRSRAARTCRRPGRLTFDCTGDFGASGTPTDSTEITATMTVDAGAPPPSHSHGHRRPLIRRIAIAESDETNNTKTETTAISGTVCGGSPCVDLFTLVTGPPFLSRPPAASGSTRSSFTNSERHPSPTLPRRGRSSSCPSSVGTITSVVPSPRWRHLLPTGGRVAGTARATRVNSRTRWTWRPGASATFTVLVLEPARASVHVRDDCSQSRTRRARGRAPTRATTRGLALRTTP